VTSTDASAILGLNPYKSAFEVWAEKTGRAAPADLSGDEKIEFGIELEPAVARIYLRRTKRKPLGANLFEGLPCRTAWLLHPNLDGETERKLFLWHRELDWLGCSPDLIVAGWTPLPDVLEQRERFGPGISEIKTTSVFAGKQNYEEDDIGNFVAPQWVQIQLQHQLLVSGLQWGTVPAAIGGQRLVMADYDVIPELQSMMLDELGHFLEAHVKKDIPPPVDGSESASRAIAKAFPTGNGKTVELDSSFLELDTRRELLKIERKKLADEYDALTNRLKVAIGDNEIGALAGRCMFRYGARHRDAYLVQAADWRQIDRSKWKDRK
jgi:predicted phage-related endonuclease